MDYSKELESAIAYIENNLYGKLELKEIAEHANISAFHFHRIFKLVIHETVMSYVRKRRLTEALRELIGTDKRILDVALDCGFDSQESFSRAFKNHFGISPGKARESIDILENKRYDRYSFESLDNNDK